MTRLNNDEYVVDADGEDEERDDFDCEECSGDAEISTAADRAADRRENNYYATEAEDYFAFQLEVGKK